jgi:hypothetical protein
MNTSRRYSAVKSTTIELARLGSECSFIGLEPACGISVGISTKAVGDWKSRDHEKVLEVLNRAETCNGVSYEN